MSNGSQLVFVVHRGGQSAARQFDALGGTVDGTLDALVQRLAVDVHGQEATSERIASTVRVLYELGIQLGHREFSHFILATLRQQTWILRLGDDDDAACFESTGDAWVVVFLLWFVGNLFGNLFWIFSLQTYKIDITTG